MKFLFAGLFWLLTTNTLWPTEPFFIDSWKILGPFMAAPRDGGTDHLLKYGGEENIIPHDSQVFYSQYADQGILKWEDVSVDSDRVEINYEEIDWNASYTRLGGVGLLNMGYAYTEIRTDSDQVALVNSQQVGGFYVNGRGYQGEPYYANYQRTAVPLHKGINRILVKFAGKHKRSFRFQIEPTELKALFLEDVTQPDLLDLEEKKILLAVPILNSTKRWLRDLTIELDSSLVLKEKIYDVPPIPPLGVLKIPLEIELSGFSESFITVELTLRDSNQEELSRIPIKLNRKSRTEPLKQTFLSSVDGSVQYYGIRYPEPYDPKQQYAVIFSLHGAGVEAIHLAGQYSSKDWAFVITPTNRRPYGFDWQDWGRLDLEEVFEEVMKEYPIDPDRVYLAGSSMGGQGVWHIGLHDPSRFAALAPQAGWTGFQHYSPFTMQKSQMFAAPDLLNVRNRVMQDSNNLYFLENLQHLPVVITHGAEDRTVPPMHPRMFQKFLEEREFVVNYRELPEQGHWWDEPRSSGGGSDAVDNKEILDFLKQQVRNRYPQQFNIRLFDLSINDTFYWIRVLSQKEALQQTKISAEVIGEEVLLNTENVSAIEVDWGALNLPIQRIIWNQQHYPISDDSPMLLGPEPDSAAQLATKYPALKSVFFRPFVLVYGTQGGTLQQEMLLHRANQIAIRFWRRANGYVRVMADTDVTESIESEFNLVMLGNPESNLMIKKLLPHTPLEFTENGLRLEGKEYVGELAASIMNPHPQFPERMVAFFTGTTTEAEKLSLHFLPIYSGSGTPHYVVFDKTVRQYGWGGVHSAGFFDFTNRLP